MKRVFVPFISLSISLTSNAFDSKTQYFEGSIQVSSLDGSTPYGPSYPSLTKRILDLGAYKVTECVFQKGRVFLTEMTKTEAPLVFRAADLDGSFVGKLTFSDETLSSWSYDIDVVAPAKGKITGALPIDGATIDETSGKMKIRKIWSDQALISEDYLAITKDSYQSKLRDLNLVSPIPKICE